MWSVRWIAVPGALIHTVLAAALGYGAGHLLGMGPAESVLLGVSLSVASTIVLMRALEERRMVKTEEGRICVSWLLVEDVLIVLAFVLLPLWRGRSRPKARTFRRGASRWRSASPSPRSPPSSC